MIEVVGSEELSKVAPRLAEILHACVHAGASVSFILPFSMEDALAFWTGPVARALAGGRRRLLVARVEGAIVGTVMLDWDTPPNQAHRAEVAKMLVHPASRRRGIARALMAAIEDEARAQGRWLITLDTAVGHGAQPMYERMGYAVAGVIPEFALAPEGGRFDGTVYMYKLLDRK